MTAEIATNLNQAEAARTAVPPEDIRWSGETLAATDCPLRVGDVVLNGALDLMPPIKPGYYSAHIAGAGSVAITAVSGP